MELIAVGRTAEVFAMSAHRVLKLDRPDWNGISDFEANIARAAYSAGLPVPEVFENVVVDGRHGVVLERIHGTALSQVLERDAKVNECAEHFVQLHEELQSCELPGLADLVPRLHDEIGRSGLAAEIQLNLQDRLSVLADGAVSRLCHFDLHPDNVIVTNDRWVVIDWLTAANGPPVADLARTLLLRADSASPVIASFTDSVRRYSEDRRGFDIDALRSWTPIIAAARLAEGFGGAYATWLTKIAVMNE